jgi:hypothetical protein
MEGAAPPRAATDDCDSVIDADVKPFNKTTTQPEDRRKG